LASQNITLASRFEVDTTHHEENLITYSELEGRALEALVIYTDLRQGFPDRHIPVYWSWKTPSTPFVRTFSVGRSGGKRASHWNDANVTLQDKRNPHSNFMENTTTRLKPATAEGGQEICPKQWVF
jgi:hypothetical protein